MKYSNINIDRPPLSAADVQNGKDFGALMKARQLTGQKVVETKAWYKSGVFYGGVTGVAVITGAIMLIATGIVPNPFGQDESAHVAPIIEMESDEIEAQPAIAPPIEEGIEPFETALVNVQDGGVLELGSSTLHVPEGAFVDRNGNSVEGDVELHYREYKDKVDLMFSGIPMDYDSAGTAMYFETGGMFELRGTQEGQEVFVAPEKSITVEMQGHDKPGFNTYFFNEASAKWEYIEPSKIAQLDEVQEAEDDISGQENGTFENSESVLSEGDAVESVEYAEEELLAFSHEAEYTYNAAETLPDAIEPRAADPEARQFELAFDSSDFPELGMYSEMLFEVDESAEKFDDTKTTVAWTDMKVSKGNKEGAYVLTFSRPGERYVVNCYPVFAPGDLANAESKYREYLKEQERVQQLQKEAEERAKKAREEAEARNREWREEQEMRRAAAQQVGQSSALMVRVFSVEQFGVWNCDQPIQYPHQEVFVHRYEDRDGEKLVLANMYLADLNRESLISYYHNQPIKYDPASDCMFWALTVNNELAIANGEDLANACENGRCELGMTVYPDKIRSEADARMILKKYFH